MRDASPSRAERVPEVSMNELYATLLSWAVTLSGYPTPAQPPEVVRAPHSFFVDNACNHKECKVLGWYAGGRKLYVDDSLDLQDSLFADSIVVHEMVHYLQGVARGDDTLKDGVAFSETPSCKQLVHWEFEAYAVQREYILRYGTYLPVGSAMLDAHCVPDKDDGQPVPPARPGGDVDD
jgi:hypothetical protein